MLEKSKESAANFTFFQHLTPSQTFITSKKLITTLAFSDFLGSGSVRVRDRVSS